MEERPDGPRDAGGLKIDEGFRAWYRACPCCLGEAHPEVRRALDEERIAREARRRLAATGDRGSGDP